MNQLATLQDTPDFAAMYSVPSTGAPNIARARINRDSNIKFDDKLVTVPAPSICLKDTDGLEYYATEVYIRVYMDTMQTMVFDAEKEEYTNISAHFHDFKSTALDWFGGDKCGWVPYKQKEKLRSEDPIAYANASKVKLYRHVYGTIRMVDPVSPSTDTPKEINDVPFRMRLGPSNFKEIGDVIGGLMSHKPSINPASVEMKLDYDMDSRGSNKWFVLKYKPLLDNIIELDSDHNILRQDFLALKDYENAQVEARMRDNSTGVVDAFDDILEP